MIAVVCALVGVLGYFYRKVINPAFVKKQTLASATPTLVPDE